jgi:Arc/MetJ-type ribon-helix-helix transcriptional regulator
MKFDYHASAALFAPKNNRRGQVSYRRFATAADAIQYAIEELPDDNLRQAWIEAGDNRIDGRTMRDLYDSDDYPLQRKS